METTHAYRFHYPCGCVFGLQVDGGDGPDKDMMKSVKETGGYLERVTLDEARKSTLKRRSDCQCQSNQANLLDE